MNTAWLTERWQQWREAAEDWLGGKNSFKWVLAALLLYLALISVLGIVWSNEPDTIPVYNTSGQPVVIGTATTNMLIAVSESLLDKRGGFISNDITPPGLLMDNMPAWEYGVLIQVRELSRAMRESFSRSQSQSTEDSDLAKAEPRFNFSNNSWAVPASESEYRDGIKYLKRYRDRLANVDDPQAQFYARADNLRFWLSSVESRLGSLSQRLSASVGQRRLNTDLANDTAARQSTQAPADQIIKTPWMQIDDVFYEARGGCWALIQFLKATEQDFAEVLDNKNARVSLQQIIRELEQTQQPLFSPIILNGSGFGLLANHSLVMASYISRANAALIDLRELLSKG